LEVDWVRALGALRSLTSKETIAVGNGHQTHCISNEVNNLWNQECVERETAVARKRVEYKETAIKQKQDDMRNAEQAGLTTAKRETRFDKILNAIRDSLNNLPSSNDVGNGEDEENDEEHPPGGKLSEDDESGLVMGKMSKMVQYSMERFCQKQMKLDKLMQHSC